MDLCFAWGFNSQVFRSWSKLMKTNISKESLGTPVKHFIFKSLVWTQFRLVVTKNYSPMAVCWIQWFQSNSHIQIALIGNLVLSVHSSLCFSKQTASYFSPRDFPLWKACIAATSTMPSLWLNSTVCGAINRAPFRNTEFTQFKNKYWDLWEGLCSKSLIEL